MRPSHTKSVSLDCFDAFGDPLTFQITDAPDLGTLSPAGDGPEQFRTYTAGASQGNDAYSFRATNANGTSAASTQVVHLDPATNSAPDCISNSGFPETVAPNASKTLAPFCDDEDQDTLSYTKLSSPAHGTLSDSGGALVYTPAPGYTGPDQFNYKASDGHGGESAPATHHVDVAAPQPPTCAPSSPVVLRPNTSRTITFDCDDPSGGALSYVIDSPPGRGTLTGSGAGRSYTAGATQGDATFTWHAHSATAGDSATQTQVITVDASQNAAPVCPPSITIAAEAGEQQTVSPSCTDGDNDPLTLSKQSEPQHGTLTDSGGVLRYTAQRGLRGERLLHLPRGRRPRRPVRDLDRDGRRLAHQPRAGLHRALRLLGRGRHRPQPPVAGLHRQRRRDRDLRDHDPARARHARRSRRRRQPHLHARPRLRRQ